ncbi:MAG: alpha-galactosidase [Pseudomonadota bacterium]
MTEASGTITLTAGNTSLVIDCQTGQRPSILHWGARLAKSDAESLRKMTTRQHAPGGADAEVASSLLNETGSGLAGLSGFSAHRSGTAWASLFRVTKVEQPSESDVRIVCDDGATHVRATLILGFNPDSNLLTCQTQIENLGDTPLSIDWCASASLPLDPRASRVFGFTGRWSGEFNLEEIPPFQGSYVRENKNGRTSHDNFPGLFIGTAETHEQAGPCFGYHLGWSGNNRVRVDRLSDGRAFVQMGEYFFPGEMSLAPGGTYRTPRLYAGFTSRGFSALSRKFHHHLTDKVMDGRIRGKSRPVHYNTWEAVYFNHDQETLFALAEKAAWVGAERFVLDDGWFGGRRNDKAGLGDWWVSSDVYPEGLGPLVDHVTGLGMEFGLWFEPEMVNPDSDLYRAHPDWILHAEGVEQVPFRNQFVLDLTRPEVSDYLFECMHKLLSDHDIGYIKWDMNRDVHHPGSRGRPVIHKQTRALYALIERLRAAHPRLEIESCSSGGARADYGILRRTDRIWTSDSNDALDRQRIQRGASHFFPLSIMGAHVGPETCHITGRRLTMEMRVATALFGHMGMELNLLEEPEQGLETLKAGIALHQRHRDLIHGGQFHRLDTPDHVNAVGVVSEAQDEALFSWCNLTGHRETVPGRFHVPGLDLTRSYRTRIAWPNPVASITSPSVIDVLDLNGEGTVLPAEALAHVGLQVPLLHPETCLIYHFEAV